MIKEYKLTDKQLEILMDASKPTPVMFQSCEQPLFVSAQERANQTWKELGDELGFDYTTVKPSNKGNPLYFTAKEKEWKEM